eukprot:8758213-Pyramimonas_sp.AAC.1
MALGIPHNRSEVVPTWTTQHPHGATLAPQQSICTVRPINAHHRPTRLQPILHESKVRLLRR